MAKFEYTVKFNGRRYFPGEEVPIETEKTEKVAVAEKAAVTESVEEKPKEEVNLDEPKSVSVKEDADKKKNGRKPKA